MQITFGYMGILHGYMSPFQPSLPPYCEPTNDFLRHFSETFHVCVPTPLAFVSNTLGIFSIIAWLFAQLPQIYKNWSISSTSGLSIFFLVEWCLGDLSNLLGALFTHQASWQVTIGSYYVFVDVCLVAQWAWYERLRHGNIVKRVWKRAEPSAGNDWSGGGMQEYFGEGGTAAPSPSTTTVGSAASKQRSRPRIIFRTPTFQKDATNEHEKSSPNTPGGTTIHRPGPSSLIPSPSPRTILLIACLAAITQASPITNSHPTTRSHHPTHLENAGTVLSWLSTILYLGSRLPQLIKNYQRQSTAGLSPHLFAAAFCGNLFYSAALASNPCAWYDFEPYGGGGGWAGANGSDRVEWTAAALPFFLGAFGVLGLDASVGLQFVLYGEGKEKVVVIEDGTGQRGRWRKVSGWMRGWVPSISEAKVEEQEALVGPSEQRHEGYGAV